MPARLTPFAAAQQLARVPLNLQACLARAPEARVARLDDPPLRAGLQRGASPYRALRRRGLTLTEVMIAIAITLVLLGVLIRMFSFASGEIQKGRAIMEMAGQVRMTADRLQSDLNGVTVPLLPWTRTADGLGYFEYFEGTPWIDDPTAPDTTIGDVDDVLMFTARSKDRPFRGRYWRPGGAPTIIESDLAEVIWWTELQDTNANGQLDTGEQLILHRRVLLIRPDLNEPTTGSLWANNDLKTFLDRNDISVRPTSTGLAANSLSDLSRRENRFAHSIGYPAPTFPSNNLAEINQALQNSFPYPIDRAWLNTLIISGNYEGEDVVLSSLVSFDVKAYDPAAPVFDDRVQTGLAPGTVPLTPSDPGYLVAANGSPPIGTGCYVDIGFAMPLGLPIASNFSRTPAPKSQLGQFAYSTWPESYETDGLDQDGIAGLDQGTNGVDDDNVNGTDDAGERETSPPYPVKLRGIQILMRVIEPDTQQVEQRTLIHNFIPE